MQGHSVATYGSNSPNGRTDTLRVLGVSWVRLSAVSSFPLVGAAAAQQHTQRRRPCRGDGQFERPNKQLEIPSKQQNRRKKNLRIALVNIVSVYILSAIWPHHVRVPSHGVTTGSKVDE